MATRNIVQSINVTVSRVQQRDTHKTVKKKQKPRLQKTGSAKNARSNQMICGRFSLGRRSFIMKYPQVKATASIAVKMARDLRMPIVERSSR